ncbi:hypothetical protein BDZ90DRAFT_229094 [Jaminaea rosea]|uniref:Sec39 domain-containing protein n=1 Tax=Jaminaea rosea TaxID=1569628 RepID=A0A316UXM5_9BASI|nr:hypothetical protein BDZ90DRAFT_229094 [Jaminaea rosea]PWN30059.1 hypothetical protein BDZ90DRAFT_229094 [Jaminaea rosea]
MAIDSQTLHLQRGFLELNHITPAVVAQLLNPLAQHQPQWVALAVLQCFTNLQRASHVSSIEAADSLLQVGIQAASSPSSQPSSSSSSSPSPNVHGVLSSASSSLKAFQKTGMAVHLQEAASSAQSLHDEEEDEDSAWFDTKRSQTPSPALPASAPSIHLASLLVSLARPRKTALLLAPYPPRLVVWLRAINMETFAKVIWPERYKIIEASLRHLAIADGRLDDLVAARLLPRLDGDDVWHELLKGGLNQEEITRIPEWYLNQARSLDARYQATQLALELVQVGMAVAPAGGDDDTAAALRRLYDQLETSQCFGRQQEGSVDTNLSRDPASVICEGLAAGILVGGEGLKRALRFACSASRQSQDTLIRQVCWKMAERRETEAMPSFLDSVQASHEERLRIGLAILLRATSTHDVKGLEALLVQPLPSSSALEHLSDKMRRHFPRDKHAPLPTSEELFQAFVSVEDLTILVQRSQLYLQALAQTRLRQLFSAAAPYRLITATTAEDQSDVLKSCLSDRHPGTTSSPQEWLTLHSALLSLCGSPAQLLNALTPAIVSSLLIRAALKFAPHEAAQSLIEQAIESPSSLQPDEIDSLLIQAARDIIDRATGGRAGVADLKRARQILSLTPSSQTSPIPASLLFLNSVLRLMQLSQPLPSALHASVTMTPLEIRLASDKLDIVRRWLSAGLDAGVWRRRNDVLETAIGLCEGSETGAVGEPLGDEDKNSKSAKASSTVSRTSRSKESIRVKVLAMLAEAAMSHSDISATGESLDEMQAALKVVQRRAKRASTPAAGGQGDTILLKEAAAAEETAWTTLFAMSKHPNAISGDGEARQRRKQWLGEAISLCPPERLSELLKRWTAMVSEDGEEEAADADIMGAVIAGLPGHTAGSKGATSSASAAQAVQGLGAGVFSLAAAAVNTTAWSLSPSLGTAALPSASSGASSYSPATATAALGSGAGGALGNALSSLAGHGHRFRSGLWGVASAAAAPAQAVDSSPSLAAERELQPPSVSAATGNNPSPAPRTAASLFDDFGPPDASRAGRRISSDDPSASAARSSSPSVANPFASYLDPAERAARAARGFLGGGRATSSSSAEAGAAGGGGWSALGSRGMNWLVGEEAGDGHSR